MCVRAGARLARYRLSIGGLQQTGNRRADYRFVGLRFLLRLWTRSLPTAVMSLFPHTRPLLPVNLFMDSLPVPRTQIKTHKRSALLLSLSLSSLYQHKTHPPPTTNVMRPILFYYYYYLSPIFGGHFALFRLYSPCLFFLFPSRLLISLFELPSTFCPFQKLLLMSRRE